MTSAASPSVRFEIEVLTQAQPISGRVTEATGATREFHGWIELIRAIEDATATEEAALPTTEEP